MNPGAISEALAIAVQARVPVLLWGSPGTGKTSVVRALGAALGWPVEVVIGSIREPADFAGLPVVANASADMAAPSWARRLAAAGQGLLFLDELTTAPPAVQGAMLRVVLERVVGDLVLPPDVRIVAAANPPGEAADGWEITPPLANRLVHLDWPVDAGAVARGLAFGFSAPSPDPAQEPSAVQRAAARATVAAFLHVRPSLVLQVPASPAAAGRGWPSPRSWEAVSTLLAACDATGASEEGRAALVTGAVGDGPGFELLSWLEHADLPDPEAVLADPDGFVLPERSDRAFAVLPVEPARTWAAARVWAARQAPYLATALLALQPVVVEQSEEPPHQRFDLSAFPADERWHVYVDPDVLAAVTVPTLGFWLLHQATHLLRHHGARYLAVAPDEAEHRPPLSGRSRRQARWNLAADAEIDDDLHAGEITPSGLDTRVATPARLGLPDHGLAEESWNALAGGWDRCLPVVDCGSGCDGCHRPWNCDLPGLSPVAGTLLRRDVARRIREHRRARGSAPAGWRRWADEVLEPVVDWRRALAALVRRGVADSAGRVDFTYRRPSRRASAVPGVVLPSLRQPQPDVAVVVDTSGSMSDPMLAQALAEVQGVAHRRSRPPPRPGPVL